MLVHLPDLNPPLQIRQAGLPRCYLDDARPRPRSPTM